MKRNWPFISLASGLFAMLCGFIYYVAFVGMRYEVSRSEVSAPVATQAHISSVISWLGACFFFLGLLGSFVRLILAAKLSNEAGKTNKLKITVITVVSSFVIAILCIVSVMSGGFFIFGPLAVVSAWLLHAPMWVSAAIEGHNTSRLGWGEIFVSVYIQFFTIIWFFVWFVAHRYGKRAA